MKTNFLKLYTLVALIVIILISDTIITRAANEQVLPVLPSTGKTLTDFIPEGWELVESDGGDLNKDGLLDKVAVIQKSSDADDTTPRILFVIFKQKNSSYILSCQQSSGILLENEGGSAIRWYYTTLIGLGFKIMAGI